MIEKKETFSELKQRRKKLKEMAHRDNKKDPLMECTMEQLRSLARELRLKGFSRLDKGDLVSFLVEKADPASLLVRLLSTENHLLPVKDERFFYIGNWASILGCGIGVIALAVTIIVSSSSAKQLNDFKTTLDRYDPLKRDEVLKEKDKQLAVSTRLLTEKERKIKELEKPKAESYVGAPGEHREAHEKVKKVDLDALRDILLAVGNNLTPAQEDGDAPVSPALAAEETKEKCFSSMGIWTSILGFVVGVIALVVTIILNISSAKKLNDVKTKLGRYNPLTRTKVIKEMDEMLTEMEKKIKKLEKAVAKLCVGAPGEHRVISREPHEALKRFGDSQS
jgi:hypothetical protein